MFYTKSTNFLLSCEDVCHEVDASVSMKHSPRLKGDKRSLILSHIGMAMAREPGSDCPKEHAPAWKWLHELL